LNVCCVTPAIRDRYAITENDIARLIASLRADALIIPDVIANPHLCSDPDDDKFLACALTAQADYIVTGDPDLLILGQHQEVTILKPQEFLTKLREEGETR
jgi:putative PIN family toxin of toxin-antitoxin system